MEPRFLDAPGDFNIFWGRARAGVPDVPRDLRCEIVLPITGPPPIASPAPEPSQFGTLALMGLSLGGLIVRAKRRQRAA